MVLSLILFKFLSLAQFGLLASILIFKKKLCSHIIDLVHKVFGAQGPVLPGDPEAWQRGTPGGGPLLAPPSPPPESLCGQLPSGVYALLMHPDNLPL